MTLAARFTPGRYFCQALTSECALPIWDKFPHQRNQGRCWLLNFHLLRSDSVVVRARRTSGVVGRDRGWSADDGTPPGATEGKM